MNENANEKDPAAIVLDIEGTIGPITWVKDVLFPYARDRMPAVVNSPPSADRAEVASVIADIRAGLGEPDADLATVAAELRRLSDADLKVPALKRLQGIVWRDGYRSGELRAPVYADVPPALERWTHDGRQIFVYSSGSELAQRLWFGHTDHGDLSTMVTGWFDTVSAGPKKVSRSYERITAATGHAPTALLFLSDSPEELRAAHAVGWSAVAVRRAGPQQPLGGNRIIESFDELSF